MIEPNITLITSQEIIDLPTAGATISLTIFFKMGSHYDPIGKEGLAHLAEHLLLKQLILNPTMLHQLEAIGGKWNGFTTKSYVMLYVVVPADQWQIGLHVLVNSLLTFNLTPKQLEIEKKVITHEIRTYRQNTPLYSSAWWEESVLGSRLVMGTSDSLDRITIGDVKGFVNALCQPEQMVWMVGGSVGKPQIITSKIQKSLELFSHTSRSNQFFKSSAQVVADQHIHILPSDHRQTYLSYGFAWPSTSQAEQSTLVVIADVIVTLLTGGWSTRLKQKLRQQTGWAYHVQGQVKILDTCTYLKVHFATQPDFLVEVITFLHRSFKMFQSAKVTVKELKKAQGFIKGRLLIDQSLMPNSVYWWGARSATGKELLSLEQYSALIDQVTAQDIQAFAQKYLIAANWHLALIANSIDLDQIPGYPNN